MMQTFWRLGIAGLLVAGAQQALAEDRDYLLEYGQYPKFPSESRLDASFGPEAQEVFAVEPFLLGFFSVGHCGFELADRIASTFNMRVIAGEQIQVRI